MTILWNFFMNSQATSHFGGVTATERFTIP